MIGNIHSITPELSPRVGGVADYAARLSEHWPEGALSSWWVAAGAEETARANPQWTVRPVPVEASGKNWPETGTLLVHYTQYGYAGGGIPWRLVWGLIKWRRAKGDGRWAEDRGRRSIGGTTEGGEPATVDRSLCTVPQARRLAVFFHETWLDGPLWRRRGLAAPFARWCARALARSADVVVTNCEKHAAQLAGVCEVTVLPVPANIEPIRKPETGNLRPELPAAEGRKAKGDGRTERPETGRSRKEEMVAPGGRSPEATTERDEVREHEDGRTESSARNEVKGDGVGCPCSGQTTEQTEPGALGAGEETNLKPEFSDPSGLGSQVSAFASPQVSSFKFQPLASRSQVSSLGLRLVIFGLPETRLRTLRAHRAFIAWLVARGGLGELVLLGAGAETDRFAIAGMRLANELAGGAVRRVAGTDATGVSEELLRADLGLSAYDADEVGKSGTLAALFTHGCPAGCAGHDAGGLALDLSLGPDGAPRDWPSWLDAEARAKRESRVAAYVATSLDWRAHAERLAELVAQGEKLKC